MPLPLAGESLPSGSDPGVAAREERGGWGRQTANKFPIALSPSLPGKREREPTSRVAADQFNSPFSPTDRPLNRVVGRHPSLMSGRSSLVGIATEDSFAAPVRAAVVVAAV